MPDHIQYCIKILFLTFKSNFNYSLVLNVVKLFRILFSKIN